MKKPPIRVLCVDDHAFLVGGLKARLDAEPNMEFAGHLPTADDLVSHVRENAADIVVVDVDMPGTDVFEALDELRRRIPNVKAIIFSAHVRDKYLEAAYKAGAWGYLSKSDAPKALIDGIRKVSRGKLALSPSVAARAGAATVTREAPSGAGGSKLSLLTERERQILRMIGKGMSRTAIAEQICRSPMTVDNHRKAIMRKLGIHDRVELARYAIGEGLVEV